MHTTIVLLNWNGKHWLEKFLPSVLATKSDGFEILVVDNGSTDDSLDFLQTNHPDVRVLVLDKNYGFTGGNNRAIPHIHTPYFVLLNTDVEVTSNWLNPLIELMDSDETIASIQPKVMLFADKSKFEHAGGAGGYVDQNYYPFCRGRIFDILEEDKGQYEDAREIFWATGACCLIRKSVVEKIGLFEEDFFAHMEEIDFCWRAQNFGYKVMVEPKSVVYHVGGGTLPKSNPRKTYLNIHNSLAMMHKNLPKSQQFSKVFARLVLDGVWGAKSLLSLDFATIRVIFQAHWHYFGNLGKWSRRRKEIYGDHSIKTPKAGVYPKSIVWQHFVKKKRYFHEMIDDSQS